MEKEGLVSIWIGKVKSEDFINKYVELDYSDDDECKPSKFFKDFKIDIDDIDEDFIETAVYEIKSNKLNDLLDGCSYSDIVIKNICGLEGDELKENYNSVILIYNYEYINKKKKIKKLGYEMIYLNTVSYLK